MATEVVYLCFDATGCDCVDGVTMARKPVRMPVLPVGSLVFPWSGPHDGDTFVEIVYYCYRGDGCIECWLDNDGKQWEEIAYLHSHGFELGRHDPKNDHFIPLTESQISALKSSRDR